MPSLPEEAIAECLTEARDCLRRAGARLDQPLRHLACTLLVCHVTPSGISAAQIGDGAVVRGDGTGKWKSVATPATGEYLNETFFVTSEDALDRAQRCVLRTPVREVAMFSDGLQMLSLDLKTGQPFEPFFRPLFQWLRRSGGRRERTAGLDRWLRSPKLAERTDDDLSLCLATWTGELSEPRSSTPV